MTDLIIRPKPITKENFKKFGDMITTADIKPIEINNGYAKRYDGIAKLDTKKDNGESTISIFSALKRSFPCLLYTSPSPRDVEESRMPSSA